MEVLREVDLEVRILRGTNWFNENTFRPEMLLMYSLDNFNKLQTFLSDESDYEAHFAYGREIFNDFNFNVGRKMQIIKSAIKV